VSAILKRVARMEHRLTGNGKPQLLFIIHAAGWGLALDGDTCLQILRDTGFMSTGPTGLVNLCEVPDGLNTEGTQMFLREHAAEICFPERSGHAAQAPGNGSAR
jgi:hypothetical protein